MNGPNNPIGWTDFTWNPVKGLCPVGCDYCYARRIYKRFHYDPTIRLDGNELLAPYKLKKPARIFVGSTIELFASWVPKEWLERIIEVAYDCKLHTFIFLTKQPTYIQIGRYPQNVWIGVTITSQKEIWRAEALSSDFIQAKIKFASFEPLHSSINIDPVAFLSLDWIIIGAETGNRKDKIIPKGSWIQNIIEQASDCGIPIFMKDNLKPYWPDRLKQEFPKSSVYGKR
ncbi:MAG: DUF5131 family protein [archaeon]|nr:DUF5131 family protein [archaeon]